MATRDQRSRTNQPSVRQAMGQEQSRMYSDITMSSGVGGASRQADALRAEGVEVTAWGGEFMINLDDFGWFPDVLPSEADDEDGRSTPGQASG